MTNRFNNAYRRIIRETLVGSKQRNKLKSGKQRKLGNARAKSRQIKKHAAHIRPTGKVTGNETGKHSKDQDSKPVYAKNGVKPRINASQRTSKNRRDGLPYSSNHGAAGTNRNHSDRRDKLLKGMAEANTYASDYSEDDEMNRRDKMRQNPENVGFYIIYRAVPTKIDYFSSMDFVTRSLKFAKGHADHMAAVEEEDFHVIKTMVDNTGEPILFNAPNPGEYFYDGPEARGKPVYKAEAY